MSGKFFKKSNKSDIYLLLMPSVLSICLCMACLTSITWAWFSATATTSVTSITAAHFDINVTVSPVSPENQQAEQVIEFVSQQQDATTLPNGNLKYDKDLKTGSYNIEITPTATSTAKGYCIIVFGNDVNDVKYVDFTSGKSPRTVGITLETDNNIKIISRWGSLPADIAAENILDNSPITVEELIPENTPEILPAESPVPTETPEPTAEPTFSPDISPSPEATVSPLPTQEPETTPETSPVATATPEVSPSPSPEISEKPEETLPPAASASPEPETSPTPEPTSTATPEPTAEPTQSPESTPAPTAAANGEPTV